MSSVLEFPARPTDATRTRPGRDVAVPGGLGPLDPLMVAVRAAYLTSAWDVFDELVSAVLAVSEAAGDVRTQLSLHYVAMVAAIERQDPSEALRHVELTLRSAGQVDLMWRAKALGWAAVVHLQLGAVTASMDALSEAVQLVEAAPDTYHRYSAQHAVAAGLRALLLFEEADALFVDSDRLWVRLRIRALPPWRCVAVNRVLWASTLHLAGRSLEAGRVWIAALTAVARWRRAESDPGVAPLLGCVEALCWHHLGESGLALAIAREALADPGAVPEMQEVRAGALAAGLASAALGDVDGARELLLPLLDVATEEDPEQWRSVTVHALAQVESVAAGPDPLVDAARGLAESSVSRLWQDRAGRFDALRHRGRLQSVQAATGLAAQESRLDALTGLGNRRALQEFTALPPRVVGEPGWTLVFCDADRFKRVNDELSHDVGDRLLVAFAEVVATHCRPVDLAIRYGGDEFVVVVGAHGGGRSCSSGAALARRLRRALTERSYADVHPRLGPQGDIAASMSIGVAWAPTLAGALASSDAAMLAAKRAGRNRVVVTRASSPEPAAAAV